MKRLIAAVGLTAVTLSASAVEYGAPFEQLNLDRASPNVEFAPVEAYVADSRAPFDQLTLDRALPNLRGQNTQYAATAGNTRTDASAEAPSAPAESPWANDWNFIAPAP